MGRTAIKCYHQKKRYANHKRQYLTLMKFVSEEIDSPNFPPELKALISSKLANIETVDWEKEESQCKKLSIFFTKLAQVPSAITHAAFDALHWQHYWSDTIKAVMAGANSAASIEADLATYFEDYMRCVDSGLKIPSNGDIYAVLEDTSEGAPSSESVATAPLSVSSQRLTRSGVHTAVSLAADAQLSSIAPVTSAASPANNASDGSPNESDFPPLDSFGNDSTRLSPVPLQQISGSMSLSSINNSVHSPCSVHTLAAPLPTSRPITRSQSSSSQHSSIGSLRIVEPPDTSATPHASRAVHPVPSSSSSRAESNVHPPVHTVSSIRDSGSSSGQTKRTSSSRVSSKTPVLSSRLVSVRSHTRHSPQSAKRRKKSVRFPPLNITQGAFSLTRPLPSSQSISDSDAD